ncbi:MAG: amidohydrolase family protein, partial [Verrucomicrobia bacterium]|nr:amidohydrolase family protein [Verrucomicrobiota bacterium]
MPRAALPQDHPLAPDLVVLNADIRTLHPRNPRMQALAVRDGRIFLLGDSATVRKLAMKQTRVIDAKGMLAPGMLADFVMLDRNLFTVPPDELQHARVALTVMDGRVV